MPPQRKSASIRPSTPVEKLDEHRRRLIALRDKLTAEIEIAQTPYVASLARQLQSVLEALATLPEPGSTGLAQLKAQQAARMAEAGIAEMPSRVSAPIRPAVKS